jgi:hypothetical protein
VAGRVTRRLTGRFGQPPILGRVEATASNAPAGSFPPSPREVRKRERERRARERRARLDETKRRCTCETGWIGAAWPHCATCHSDSHNACVECGKCLPRCGRGSRSSGRWRGTPFVRGDRLYCGDECSRKAEAARERARRIESFGVRVCECGCGREFIPTRKNQVYNPATRAACKQRAHRRRVTDARDD